MGKSITKILLTITVGFTKFYKDCYSQQRKNLSPTNKSASQTYKNCYIKQKKSRSFIYPMKNIKIAIKLNYYFQDTCSTPQKYTCKSFLKSLELQNIRSTALTR